MINIAGMVPTLLELFIIIAVASIVLRTATAGFSALHVRRPVPPLRRAVGVSVLKPLRGVDDGLLDNLRSLLQQDYPGEVELLLGTTDYGDPARAVAHALQREFPGRAIRVVLSPAGIVANPKVANLIGLTAVASHEVLLVSDANVRVGPTYLRDMVASLQDTGLVANLVAGVDDGSLGAVLENLQLNGFTNAAVCGALRLADHPCVIGKSLMLRRRDLAALGGWSAFGDVLGEDYALGQAFARAGLGVCTSSHVVAARSSGWTVTRFLERHLRWHQMRRWIAPGMYALEPVMVPTLWCMGAGTIALLRAEPVWAGAAALGIAWAAAIEGFHARILRGAWPSGRYLAAVPVKDLLIFAVWMRGWWKRDVAWRGHAYRIGPGSVLAAASSGALPETARAPLAVLCEASVPRATHSSLAYASHGQHDSPETAA
jgi:ceramide glucosyltransferase